MELVTREAFLAQAAQGLAAIYDELAKTESLEMSSLPQERTAVLVLDMINGFAKEGALASPRVQGIIEETVRICQSAQRLGMPVIAFADEHTEASPEFAAFPSHCLRDTPESQVVEELAQAVEMQRIGKNSTNGFLEPAFAQWLNNHAAIDHFVLLGDCTDICVLQMAQTLKAWFNRQDRSSRLIVPMSAVETYTLGAHDGELLNVLALYLMANSGIEIVRTLKD